MKSIIDYLEGWAGTQPHKPLFGFINLDGLETDLYTYSSFDEKTRNLAEHLSRHEGLKAGDRVLLVFQPGLDIVVAFFACARLGLVPVPVVPPSPMGSEAAMEKLTLIANDCHAVGALTNSDTLVYIRKMASGTRGSPRLNWISTDGGIAESSSVFRNHPNPVLFLQYTSGSTGDPRGVMVSHDNVIHNARSTIDHVPIGVSWLPQYHDMGLIGYYLFPVIVGGTTYGLSSFDFLRRPALWLQTISRVRATYASSPNFGFEYCLRPGKITSEELLGVDLSSLRVLMNAAEPVRPETCSRFYERFAPYGLKPETNVVAYGLAENTLAVTHYGRRVVGVDILQLRNNRACIAQSGTDKDTRIVIASCGRPLDGVQVRIVDLQTKEVLPEREIGEIWVAGDSVCQGYWNRERATREVFANKVRGDFTDSRAYLRTGDLGFFHEGDLFVCGRTKDLIIIRGVNHYPQDIETVVESMSPKVRSGGVVAFNGEKEALVLVIEVRNRRDIPDPAEIARGIRTRCLVEPHTIAFVPARTIVRTTSGKLARRLTRELFLSGKMSCLVTYHTPAPSHLACKSSSLKDRFRYVFARFDSAAAQTSTFAEMGFDSLMLMEVLLEFETALEECGAADLVEEIDESLLQRLTIAEFSHLLDLLEDGSQRGIAACRSELRRARSDFDTQIHSRMRSDAQLSSLDRGHIDMKDEPVANVLLTGATGFFGPFLLSSLLRKTPYTYYVLTRATGSDHAWERVRDALQRAAVLTPSLDKELCRRVRIVCGNIAHDNLGLAPHDWESLTREVHAVVHNAACVNYVLNYEALKPHNIDGTRTILRFAHSARRKEVHFISSTFIFGWTVKGLLVETDNNDEMANLDFGYAQTKWVAEQLVLSAQSMGLDVRIYRPSLISASTNGVGDRNDVAIRLLAFMINHRIAIDTTNQVSIVPADVAADNIAAIVGDRDVGARTFHVTVDSYYNMMDLTRIIERQHGYAFTYYGIAEFIDEMNRRCTKSDPLYPLLSFFNRSASKIDAMQLKRYRNDQYQKARERLGIGRDPTLEDTVSYLISYMRDEGLITFS